MSIFDNLPEPKKRKYVFDNSEEHMEKQSQKYDEEKEAGFHPGNR